MSGLQHDRPRLAHLVTSSPSCARSSHRTWRHSAASGTERTGGSRGDPGQAPGLDLGRRCPALPDRHAAPPPDQLLQRVHDDRRIGVGECFFVRSRIQRGHSNEPVAPGFYGHKRGRRSGKEDFAVALENIGEGDLADPLPDAVTEFHSDRASGVSQKDPVGGVVRDTERAAFGNGLYRTREDGCVQLTPMLPRGLDHLLQRKPNVDLAGFWICRPKVLPRGEEDGADGHDAGFGDLLRTLDVTMALIRLEDHFQLSLAQHDHVAVGTAPLGDDIGLAVRMVHRTAGAVVSDVRRRRPVACDHAL